MGGSLRNYSDPRNRLGDSSRPTFNEASGAARWSRRCRLRVRATNIFRNLRTELTRSDPWKFLVPAFGVAAYGNTKL